MHQSIEIPAPDPRDMAGDSGDLLNEANAGIQLTQRVGPGGMKALIRPVALVSDTEGKTFQNKQNRQP